MSNEELVKQIQSGKDVQEGMKQLWEQNKGFVYKIALKYVSVAGDVNDLDDLLQQGYFGLHKAAEMYDTAEDVPFINYSAYWIKQSISRYVKETSVSVRLPEWLYSLFRKYKNTVTYFERKFNRKPTDQELCESLGITQETLETLRKGTSASFVSELDAPVGEDGTDTLADFIPGTLSTEDEVLDKMHQNELHEALERCIDKIPDRQQELIRQRYYDGKSLDEIAASYHVTPQRISDMHQAALNNLRKPSISRALRPFLPDKIHSIAMRGSVSSFMCTNTSSTERVALRLIENEEKYVSMFNGSREAALKYVVAIKDSLTRTVFYMHILDGMSWGDIETRFGGRITAKKAERIFRKYLKAHSSEA